MIETDKVDEIGRGKPDDEPKKPPYESRQGFERVPILRGFTEIRHLYQTLKDLEWQGHTGKAFICGGYARYCASPRSVPFAAADVDIYCEEETMFSIVKEMLGQAGLVIKHENEVSITYRRPKPATASPYRFHPPVQLIKPLREGAMVLKGSMETILSNFDFTVIRAAIISETECLVDADFMHDEGLQLLRLKNIHCPISSTLRCMKYSRKGYWLRPMECLKLFLDWDKRTQEYRDRLVEFLSKSNKGEGLSKKEVEELEKLLRID